MVAAALPEPIGLTRAEPGCFAFAVTPVERVPGRFSVSELFARRRACDAHQARAASDWGRVSAGLARDYTVSEL